MGIIKYNSHKYKKIKYMKILQKRTISKTLAITSAIIVSLLLGVGVFWYNSDARWATGNPSVDMTNKNNADAKQTLIEEDERDNQPTPRDETSPSVDLWTKQESDNTVTVFTKLSGYDGGKCELTITNNSKNHAFNADIIYQEEYSSCAGFSIPTDTVGAGKWSLTLKTIDLQGNNYSKTITSDISL